METGDSPLHLNDNFNNDKDEIPILGTWKHNRKGRGRGIASTMDMLFKSYKNIREGT